MQRFIRAATGRNKDTCNQRLLKNWEKGMYSLQLRVCEVKTHSVFCI